MGKLTLRLPAGTVTPPIGVTTCPSMLPTTHTAAPPGGAGPVSVTVPVALPPARMLVEVTDTVDKLAAGAAEPGGVRTRRVSGA